ncbi:transcriptional regulator [Saccharomonospora sp. CUA-673]|uniref:ArsR/SmtB family transcription factor n=1 Tax=Saccharomonospora sp. CUA-673 TaxID=1904969 RepID=UPI00095EBE4D|nr:metalloregulator ArsR/SmtB family transcription factor [Saccharomonospora sp. CUA-673]OLT46706.1 transcriptional regulator [Saccharomonospora sp. CUA-673]
MAGQTYRRALDCCHGRDACALLCIDFDHAEALRARLPEAGALAGDAERLRALGDPTRLRVAHALRAGEELCVCDVAWIVGSSQGLVSHHLRHLRSAGLVTSRRDGKLVMYRLSESGLATMDLLAAVPDRP